MNSSLPEPLFEIHAYYVSDLAKLYVPNLTSQAAVRQLWRWISYHPLLNEELKQNGYVHKQRCFTPKQVACIVKHLGEP
ncbi:hypothetical protein M2459_003197 [Parabacteroides sp. PF5-5]|uniref:DUF4248 domain-containing protein n=1 Tax=unclassified Parabacteroides TaxID=2649774 RepID=UPI002474F00E|nr:MULTISPECIES: DUF4248 domain-containing protein [unclassified Parabacteroides]MDH6306473.1 hypothetical protein [Parabacteroides sp. PH5-39]MDH6317375.1 hypothetical protein [Parabacteroides sp. PF5-13]MDH6321184.1 hypothetical protein [Parabacteroides sp. PH5-13]MDH6324916.1 hypothetical protein [Parabacteroides sp. PH5-8]MDH6328560.1 hypothetical protein [Parabacteroides sp. PH5-41]